MTSKNLTDESYPYLPVHIHALENRRYGRNRSGMIAGTDERIVRRCVEEELVHILETSEDSIILIDPAGMYQDFMWAKEGTILSFGAPDGHFLNPFYIEMNGKEESEWEQLRQKSDYLISFCEALASEGSGFGITQKTVLEYCIKKIYEPFFQSYKQDLDTYQYELLPTLNDLFSILTAQKSSQANMIAERLKKRENEIYRTLTVNKTGTGRKNLWIYHFETVPECMKAALILTILDKTRQERNTIKKEQTHTWLYINDIHRLFLKSFVSEYLTQYEADRWILTGLTDNPAVFLEHNRAGKRLCASHYVVLLIPSRLLRSRLLNLLSASASESFRNKQEDATFGLVYNKVNVLSFHVPL